MTFDHIITNPPYGKIGCDITKTLLNDIPHKEISILGTRTMLCKHNDHLALEYVYIEDYILEPPTKCKWVSQIILLGHDGKCTIIPLTSYQGNREEEKPNELRIPFIRKTSGNIGGSINTFLTRNRATSEILSLSDEDYEYVKAHWDEMDILERFWWLHDHGFYRRFIEQ